MVKGEEGGKRTTEGTSEVQGGDAVRDGERTHPEEETGLKVGPTNVLCGCLTRGTWSADGLEEVVDWAASGATRGPGGQERRARVSQVGDPCLQGPSSLHSTVGDSPATLAQEVRSIRVAGFLQIWGLVLLEGK